MLGLLAALACAAPAGALTRVGTAVEVDAVHLAGPEVVFLERGPHRTGYLNTYRIRAGGTHGAPRRLGTLAPVESFVFGWLDLDVHLAASPDRVTVLRDDFIDSEEPIDIRRAHTEHTLSGIAGDSGVVWSHGCSVGEEPRRFGNIAMSGDAILTDAPGCTDEGLMVRSHSGRGAVLRRLEDAYFQTAFDIAGSHAAYRMADGRLAVTDWQSGARVYDWQAPGVATLPGEPLSVQDDGKVAYTLRERGCENRLAWVSREEPVPHELPHRTCGRHVRIAADRIAFVRRAGGLRELVTTSLDGTEVVPVARSRAGFEFGPGFEGFDFDGGRLAWGAERCHDDAVYVERVRPRRVAAPERVRCPVRIVRAPLELDRRGEIRVPVRCPFGCRVDGTLETTAGTGGGAVRRLAVRPGARSAKLVFRLGALDNRRIRRRGSERVLVRVESFWPDGRTSGDAARLPVSG